MRSYLYAIIRYIFLWLFFFFIERVLFLLYFRSKTTENSTQEILLSFVYGLRIDLSTLAYLSIIPLLTFILIWNIPGISLSKKALRTYIRICVVICSLITVVNLNIYREWGTKLSVKAFEFVVRSPGEALASTVSAPLFSSLLILAGLIATGFYFSKLITKTSAEKKQSPAIVKLFASMVLIGITVLTLRGGWQLAPMNESMAYYSTTPVLNHAAINTEWAFLHSLTNIRANKNPYIYYGAGEAERILQPVLQKDKTAVGQVLNVSKPNVILVILESYTADLLESLGGEKGIDPNLEKIIADGISFEHIYSTGDRTHKGIVSVLSAFPTHGNENIIKDNNRNAKLPSLFEAFNAQGYATRFYYGGESQFANIKSYLLGNACKTIIDKPFFEKKDMNSKWGAYDHVVYNKLIETTRNGKEPFFNTLLTLTNHEPFEIPVAPHFKGDDVPNKFRSTAFYTDSCIGAFIANAKKEKWYKNTLFIFVADHGHRLPKEKHEIYDPARYHIPLIFFGEVIKPKFRGMKVETVGSQVDIASTLLNQLNMPDKEFVWSKNLFTDKNNGYAFFSWDEGFGWVNSQNRGLSYDANGRKVIYDASAAPARRDSMLMKAKAYIQTAYQNYLNY